MLAHYYTANECNRQLTVESVEDTVRHLRFGIVAALPLADALSLLEVAVEMPVALPNAETGLFHAATARATVWVLHRIGVCAWLP